MRKEDIRGIYDVCRALLLLFLAYMLTIRVGAGFSGLHPRTVTGSGQEQEQVDIRPPK